MCDVLHHRYFTVRMAIVCRVDWYFTDYYGETALHNNCVTFTIEKN